MTAAPALALGLVYSSTSGTRSFEGSVPRALRGHKPSAFHVVERVKTRLRRLKHGVITHARLLDEQSRRGGKRVQAFMTTLTYAPGQHWNGRHISHTLQAARKWHQRQGLRMRYVWVAEMQERGAVHYHLLFWLPRGYVMPYFDRRGWWPYGSSQTELARNAVGYLAKYASKGAEGPGFPRGIRIQGAGGHDLEARRECRWWRAPAACREALGIAADIRRIQGGRFDATTGQFWESPWRYLVMNGIPVLLNTKDQPCFVSL